LKLVATIDFWDDTPGKVLDMYPEQLTNVAMYFSHQNVASITFTRPPDFVKLSEEKN
jgi:hypothetical protein